ncbi:unnamed protein product, partial [Meganyctiphanes norvegica]
AFHIRLVEQETFIKGDPDKLNGELQLDEQTEYLPYDVKFEVQSHNIKLYEVLGQGDFGVVVRGVVLGLAGRHFTDVAIKKIKSTANKTQLKALKSEIKIMVHIGRHINIVNMLGACCSEYASK